MAILDDDQHRIRKVLYRAGIGALAVVLMTLVAGVALHLYGRFCFARATAGLETLLGRELVFDFSHFEPSPPPGELQRLLEGTKAPKLSDSERRRISEAWHLARHDWSPELEEGIRTLIGRHRAGLEILHKVEEFERSSFESESRDGYVKRKLPNWALFDIARLLNVEGRLALADGDVDGGLAAAGALAGIATSFQQEPLLDHLIFALSVERSLNRLVFESLEKSEPWDANARLLTELGAVLPTWDWQRTTQEFLVINVSMSSVYDRVDVSVPWLVRFLFGHLSGAEILIGTRKSIEMIPLPYGRAQDLFDAAAGSQGNHLCELFDAWRYREVRVYLGHEPFTSRDDLVTFGKMFARLSRSPARDPSGNSWGRWIGLYLKCQVIAAERQLMRAALALRRDGIVDGGYPPERPASAILTKPSPFTGQLIAYRLGDDGSLVLELEGAQKLLAERWGGRSWTKDKETRDRVSKTLRDKVFAVTLPPPASYRGPIAALGIDAAVRDVSRPWAVGFNSFGVKITQAAGELRFADDSPRVSAVSAVKRDRKRRHDQTRRVRPQNNSLERTEDRRSAQGRYLPA